MVSRPDRVQKKGLITYWFTHGILYILDQLDNKEEKVIRMGKC